MKISEIVIPFPKKKKTSNVIGKDENGKLIRRDELTGLPMADPSTEFWLIDLETGRAICTKTTRPEAETEKKRLEKWEKLSVGIQEV